MKKILSLVLIAMLLMSGAFAESALRVGLMPSAVGAPVKLALRKRLFYRRRPGYRNGYLRERRRH